MAVDMFIKIGDVQGEASEDGHVGDINVLAWSWGMSQSGSMQSGGGGGSGKVNVQDLSFTKWVDKASANLLKMCCDGTHIPEALLVVRKAGGSALEYIKVKLTEVLVSSVSTGGSGGEDRLTENVTLNFRKVNYEYQPQKSDGSKDGGAITMGWDMSANKPV